MIFALMLIYSSSYLFNTSVILC